ncbi:segregation and condensation protein B [Breznakia sp. PF5-3]|uniref:SMC-Scp complex subunit ScpB n=1 Tax=unclassified Breznakia TaxID=2623764 RepID=UPI002406DA66|nr:MULTISPECIES: SMC-Scp complex subunit ScpB [unclassified Breznakia]MDL2276948.1 SMC-Scp complex subunit ScpB [Breznakia sp. OttesenSCG-928-G09]MDF9825333.1 segregation and condensation protein B [Breznakia sp. PM6-1]MDF9836188.1 segregation and condensation protein B [Breznakia sp. PF5-3]MDF9838414.1 segregation and condensation protein B [Breznakia sp. PFB2-8]MDF9860430.1 segregation and condensation protein B [Breznakia sp. PH5-24]
MKHIIEGLLFLSGDEGLSAEQLLETLDIDEAKLTEEIKQLMDDYLTDSHGIELVHFGGRYKFVSKESVYEYAEKLFSSNKMATLSSAALETLAIIAYKQPITRVEIEEIRGVGCDMMIRKLLARSLVKECGRSDAPGRPFLYEVTEEFMDSFKLESLKELPELEDYSVNVQEELFDNR